MSKEENKFHLVYTTEEDTKNETEKLTSQITEDKISIFSFKGESLYETGSGHNFVYGFYVEYITKTGIRATQYMSGLWNIGSDDYEWKNNEFVIIPKEPYSMSLARRSNTKTRQNLKKLKVWR